MTRTQGPTQAQLEHAVEYCFDVGGTILRAPGEPCWHFDVRGGLFDSRCEFRDASNATSAVIKKTRLFSGTFEMTERGERVSMIRRLNVLRTRYRVELAGGVIWDVHVPLYSVHFHAQSNAGAQIFIRV